MQLTSIKTTETNSTFVSRTFNIKQSPIAFEILSNKLYSNPILAIIRELLCNAYDSHVVAGTTDIPIDVIVPDGIENNLIIRDYGTGLSKDDVLKLYTTFFDSTKNNSNLLTGGFGLGSKTPFAYSSSFSVTSYYNGIEYNFIAVKKDGYPSITEIASKPTSEHNGLKINIPIKQEDSSIFLNELHKFIKFIPEIKINCNKEIVRLDPYFTVDNINIYCSNDKNINIYLKQGQNVYSLYPFLNKTTYGNNKIFYEIARLFSIVIEVPIGTVEITPSRESISVESTEIINDLLKNSILLLNNNINNFIEKLLKNDEHNYYTYGLIKTILNLKYFNNNDEIAGRIDTYSYGDTRLLYRLPYRYSFINKSTINLDSTDCREIYNNIKTYVVFTASARKHGANRKINVVLNYSDKLEEYCNILVIPLNDTTGSSLHLIRSFKNLAFILNNIEGANFNIECLFLKEFLKKFEIDNLIKKYNIKKSDEKKILVNLFEIDIEGGVYSSNLGSFEIDDIKKRYSKNNTLILFNDNKNININELTDILILSNIRRINNYNIYTYLKNKINNFNGININLLYIAKSNIKYFSEYGIFNIKDIKEYLDNVKFSYRKRNYKENLYNIQENVVSYIFDKIVNKNIVEHKNNNKIILNEKELQFIKNTFWYKKLLVLSNFFNKDIYLSTLNLSLKDIQTFESLLGKEEFNKYYIDFPINFNLVSVKDQNIFYSLNSLLSGTIRNKSIRDKKNELFNLLRRKY